MNSQAFTYSYKELVQQLLNKKYASSYGENMVLATDQGRIKFVFPTTHYGVNEMECGSWSFGKRGLRFVISGDYDTMYSHIQNNTKPKQFTEIKWEFPSITPKERA